MTSVFLVIVSIALIVLCFLTAVADAGFCRTSTAIGFDFTKGNFSVEWNRRHPLLTKKFSQDENIFVPLDSEEEEMTNLILSLIIDERTDESRRNRLSQIFQENLVVYDSNQGSEESYQPSSSQNKDFFHFVQLFDATLNKLGDRIQKKARDSALIKRREKLEEVETVEEGSSSSSSESGATDGTFETMLSEEERQLWACIDMLVQSKTIVKSINAKAN
jgi:hypothetical protein